jgi:hypothetical protein
MHVHTRVKDKVDAVEGAELQCNICTIWKPATAQNFYVEMPSDKAHTSNPGYHRWCNLCSRVRASLAVWYVGDDNNKHRKYPTVQEVREAVAPGNHTFIGALNQARHGGETTVKPLSTAAREELRERREELAGKPDMCYLVGMEGDRTAVKIGHSTNVYRRIAQYQAGNPRKLVVMGLIEGGQQRERELHQKYMHLHSDAFVGEWFSLDPAILSEFGARRMP